MEESYFTDSDKPERWIWCKEFEDPIFIVPLIKKNIISFDFNDGIDLMNGIPNIQNLRYVKSNIYRYNGFENEFMYLLEDDLPEIKAKLEKEVKEYIRWRWSNKTRFECIMNIIDEIQKFEKDQLEYFSNSKERELGGLKYHLADDKNFFRLEFYLPDKDYKIYFVIVKTIFDYLEFTPKIGNDMYYPFCYYSKYSEEFVFEAFVETTFENLKNILRRFEKNKDYFIVREYLSLNHLKYRPILKEV